MSTTDLAQAPQRPGTAPVISLEHVSKVYRSGPLEVRAVDDVSLRLDDGEYVAITGPSGSGKSTMMHILGCLDIATSGLYRLAGQDVSDMTEEELAAVRNQRVGFVFQQFNLLASLPAWRNVELPLVYAGTPRARRRELAMAALERVGLGDRVDHRPGELSGGQQQRVAVARALVGDPSLILADEPTGNLDTASTADVLQLLDELHAAGRTVVVITHEADVAARAQRVIRMRDGRIIEDTGSSTSAYRQSDQLPPFIPPPPAQPAPPPAQPAPAQPTPGAGLGWFLSRSEPAGEPARPPDADPGDRTDGREGPR